VSRLGHFHFTRLRTTNYDIILADYDLGSSNGMDVLDLLNRETLASERPPSFAVRDVHLARIVQANSR
jgi:hypothetical protein